MAPKCLHQGCLRKGTPQIPLAARRRLLPVWAAVPGVHAAAVCVAASVAGRADRLHQAPRVRVQLRAFKRWFAAPRTEVLPVPVPEDVVVPSAIVRLLRPVLVIGIHTWVEVALLIALHSGCLRLVAIGLTRFVRRLRTCHVELSTSADIQAVQAETVDGRLDRKVELSSDQVIPGGAELLTTIPSDAEPPVHICYRPAWAMGPKRIKWLRILNKVLLPSSLVKTPLLLWGWGHLFTQAVSWLAVNKLPKKFATAMVAITFKVHVVIALTSLALFAHAIVSWWRDQHSRGQAVITDVLGSESSILEARVNALKVIFQVIVWSLYVTGVFYLVGIRLGHLLLIPSITALLLGWVGREVLSNMISGLVLHLTQPFAQGDWVTLDSKIDGWVQDTSMFYTRVMQWDKRPVYVPNFKLMSMDVQNNSRMTNRRVLFNLHLRISDIPVIPKIVKDLQEMVEAHEDIDPVQHRLVRWRNVEDWCATIWLSCYTTPTSHGIRLRSYTLIQQSVLERACAIISRHGAEFASTLDRYPRKLYVDMTQEPPVSNGEPLLVLNGEVQEAPLPPIETQDKTPQDALLVREEVLWEREAHLKEDQRKLEQDKEQLQQERKHNVEAMQHEKSNILLQSLLLSHAMKKAQTDRKRILTTWFSEVLSDTALPTADTSNEALSASSADEGKIHHTIDEPMVPPQVDHTPAEPPSSSTEERNHVPREDLELDSNLMTWEEFVEKDDYDTGVANEHLIAGGRNATSDEISTNEEKRAVDPAEEEPAQHTEVHNGQPLIAGKSSQEALKEVQSPKIVQIVDVKEMGD